MAKPTERAKKQGEEARSGGASRLDAVVEAILLSCDRPATAGKIAQGAGLTAAEDGPQAVREAIARLNQTYADSGRSFRIEEVAGGWRVLTLPEFAGPIEAFRAGRAETRLTRAGMETLALVAYRQPITRAEVEAIRGVAAGDVLRNLLDRRLVDVVGRAEEVGRPMLYGTTKRFLEVFGLANLKDLPAPDAFVENGAAAATAPKPPANNPGADRADEQPAELVESGAE